MRLKSPNIRCIIHWSPSYDLDMYVQVNSCAREDAVTILTKKKGEVKKLSLTVIILHDIIVLMLLLEFQAK